MRYRCADSPPGRLGLASTSVQFVSGLQKMGDVGGKELAGFQAAEGLAIEGNFARKNSAIDFEGDLFPGVQASRLFEAG